jgi:hypothetical protein
MALSLLYQAIGFEKKDSPSYLLQERDTKDCIFSKKLNHLNTPIDILGRYGSSNFALTQGE